MTYRLNDKKKRMIFAQLQVLLKSGLSFSRSFAIVIDGTDGRDKVLLSTVFDDVISGMSLWEALLKERSFSKMDSGVIRIGEETGRMHEALKFLSDYYARKEEQKRTIINALSYPAITLCVAAAVLVFMMLVVVPMFQQVYARMGGELPAVTILIIRLSHAAPVALMVTVAVIAVVFIARRLLKESDTFNMTVSSLILKTPVAGELVKKYQITRFCRLMHLMTGSGVPVLQALRLMSDIMTFYPYKRSIERTCRIIEKGGSLSDGIAEDGTLYGKKLPVLIRVGEETNALDRMFRNQADDTSAELDFGIRQMNNILEPVLILGIGAVVAFVLIAMYMPMFRLGQAIQ